MSDLNLPKNNDENLIKNMKEVQSRKIYDVNDIQRQLEELTEDGNNLMKILSIYRGRN